MRTLMIRPQTLALVAGVVVPLGGMIPGRADGARRLEEEQRIGMGNDAVAILFSRDTGALLSLYNRVTDDEYLKGAQEAPVSPFLLHYRMTRPYTLWAQPAEICERVLGARDCRLLEARFSPLEAGHRMTLHLQVADTPLQAALEVTLADDEGVSDWNLTLLNQGGKDVSLLISFPQISGVQLGNDAAENIGVDRNQCGRTRPAWEVTQGGIYGQAGAVSMAWDAVYDPVRGSALGLIIQDPTVGAKQMWRAGQDFRVFYFPEWILQPGESRSLPPFRLLVYQGDWKPTAKAYGEWFQTAFAPVRIPGWLAEVDQYGGDWMPQPDVVAQAKADPAAVPGWVMTDWTQLPRWYQSVFGSLGGAEKPQSDTIEWAMYNDLLLPSATPYLINDSPLGQLYGSPTPLVQPTEAHPRPYRGQQHADGTYYIRPDLGGPEALRQGITRVHQQGRRCLLYVEGLLVRKESELTKDGRAERWSIQQKPGEFYAPYGENYWHMCPGCEEWQDHLAGLCARLLRETGADGIRLDSHGFHWAPCYSPTHRHGHPFQWNEGLRELLRRVYAAMAAVNPEAILETESPVDFFHESCAAALSQSPPGNDVPPMRVALPTYRMFDYAGNALDAFLYGSTQFRSTVPGADLRLRTAELHHTFASALISGELVTPEPQASSPDWDCRLWKGEGYYLLTAAHLAGFPNGYPALDPAPVTEPVTVSLPEGMRWTPPACRIDAATLEMTEIQSKIIEGREMVPLDRPCGAVYFPCSGGPELLTATDPAPFRGGESTTVELALGPPPREKKKLEVTVAGRGLWVNGQPEVTVILPATIEITAPPGTEPGVYFLVARGPHTLPLKRFVRVPPPIPPENFPNPF